MAETSKVKEKEIPKKVSLLTGKNLSKSPGIGDPNEPLEAWLLGRDGQFQLEDDGPVFTIQKIEKEAGHIVATTDEGKTVREFSLDEVVRPVFAS